MKRPFIKILNRKIGLDFPPLVIAEIGINHEGSFKKAQQMVFDAHAAGAECVKIQTHIVGDEMIPLADKVIPSHTKESIWEIIERCSLSENEERRLKKIVEGLGMIFLSTPFSRAAANRLYKMNVPAFKIGSGECNNYPLVEHIAKFGKPVILSTGMNNIASINVAVQILLKNKVPFAILHCTSMYPTPYENIRLNSILELKKKFPHTIVGFSDHSVSIWPSLGAVSLGASIIEKHFTSSKKWLGPDIPLSIDPKELADLIIGSRTIYVSLSGSKQILSEEKPTINFAYASVVTIKDINKGDVFSEKNLWVKRPGTGQLKAKELKNILGMRSRRNLKKDMQLLRSDIF